MTRPPSRPVADPRDAPGHIVRLAARVDEDAGVEMRRHGREQALRVLENAGVQIAGVGREDRRLLLNRGHHRRVGMTDVRHVVVDVQVGDVPRRRTATRPSRARCAAASRRTAPHPRPSVGAAAPDRRAWPWPAAPRPAAPRPAAPSPPIGAPGACASGPCASQFPASCNARSACAADRNARPPARGRPAGSWRQRQACTRTVIAWRAAMRSYRATRPRPASSGWRRA